MANPRIIGGKLKASGAGAVGIYVVNDTDIEHVHEIDATTPIEITSGATANVIGAQFDPTAISGAGTLVSLAGDRAAWDALAYQARHTNDIDDVAGIHHSLTGLDAIYLRKAISASQRVLGRNTAGAGDAEEVTASQVLDWLGGTRGSILYRGASGWAILAPGTAGYALVSNGAGSDPSYQATSNEVLMADGVTPPDPLTTEDETDWLYEG